MCGTIWLVTSLVSLIYHGQGGDTPLTLSAAMGWLDIVAVLSASGAPLEEPGQAGLTPLMLAVKGGHQEVTLALIKTGADKNTRGIVCQFNVQSFISVLLKFIL